MPVMTVTIRMCDIAIRWRFRMTVQVEKRLHAVMVAIGIVKMVSASQKLQ